MTTILPVEGSLSNSDSKWASTGWCSFGNDCGSACSDNGLTTGDWHSTKSNDILNVIVDCTDKMYNFFQESQKTNNLYAQVIHKKWLLQILTP